MQWGIFNKRIIMFSILKQIWWLAAVVVQSAYAQDLIASLDYGTFQGAYSAQYNISYWQKIPFAAPPTGENRQVILCQEED